MELHLKIIGWMMIILAMLHLVFPRYFEWSKQLASLSLINKQLMYVHTFFIGLIVLLMGIFCISSANEIVNLNLGRQLALGFFIFWSARLAFQFFVYSSKLWRGKKFETTIHILFSLLWIYFSAVFLFIYIS
jgi:hypothetical protein